VKHHSGKQLTDLTIQNRFLGIDAGSVQADDFFSEENVRAILQEKKSYQLAPT
jgi:hypothetical protein